MVHVDWYELQLTDLERARADQCIAEIPVGARDVLTVRRVVHGYQAIFSRTSRGCGTELRAHGNDFVRVIERIREIASVVAADQPRLVGRTRSVPAGPRSARRESQCAAADERASTAPACADPHRT